MGSGHLCLLHSFCRSPGLGSTGLPQPLTTAGDELVIPPDAFRGLGGQSWILQREMRDPAVGIFKENMLEQRLLDSGTEWPPSAAWKSCQSIQPSSLGGLCGRDLSMSPQGILHSSAWIITTLLFPVL